MPKAAFDSSAISGLRFLLKPFVMTVLVAVFAAPAVSGELSPARKFRVGDSFSYAIDYANESSSDLNQVFNSLRDNMGDKVESYSTQGLNRAVRVSLKGTLHLSVIESRDSEVLVEFRTTNASTSIRVDSRNAKKEESDVERAFGRGILARMSRSGAISDIWLPHGIQPTPGGIIRTLISHTQVVFPDKAPEGNSWETVEVDQSGRYRVLYTVLPPESQKSHGFLVLSKEKLRHITERPRTSSSRQTIKTEYVPSGTVSISVAKRNGAIQRITGSERSIIRMDGKDVGQSVTSFSMLLKRQARLNAGRLAILRGKAGSADKNSHATALWKDTSRSDSDRMLYRQKLGDDTIDSLLPRLAAAEAAPAASAEETELFLKFRSLMYLQPVTCRQISEMAARAKPESHTARILISALASIATPEAQEGLSVILRHNSGNTDYLVQLLPLVGMVEEPTIASEQLLKGFAFSPRNQEIASTAVLALGNMAGHLSITDPVRADRIISEVLSKYGASDDESVIGLKLEVLGNAALETRLSEILLHTRDPRPAVRKEAVSALRFYTHPKARETILAMLAQDVSIPVRQAAALTMGFQNLTGGAVSVMTAAFKKEADENVRVEILKILWKSRQQFAEIEALVKDAQTSDPSERIRMLSSGFLTAIKVPQTSE